MDQNKGFRALASLVLGRDLCTTCGACAWICPYLDAFSARIVRLHDCDLAEGRCYAHCPRTGLELSHLNEKRFGSRDVPVELGFYSQIMMARAQDPGVLERAQTGGVVSSLVAMALEEGIVDAAVLTRVGKDLVPSGKIATSREEVLECAGSSYVASPSLATLNRGPWDGVGRISVVGVPCQVLALEKMKSCDLIQDAPARKVVLSIGLFCTWALSYGPFMNFLRQRIPWEIVESMDISPPPERIFRLKTSAGTREFPVEEIRPFIQPACALCADMTSELADLSVGTVEGEPGWNTLILRTEAGESLLEKAIARGILEVKALPPNYLQHLVEASILKKRRALERLRHMGEKEFKYLMADSSWLEAVESGPKGGEP